MRRWALRQSWPEGRQRKFRQAAFVYLHVAILYEAAAWHMLRAGLLPARFGPPVLYLVLGAVITAVVFVALWRWQNAWIARIVFVLQAFRIPPLVRRAFFVAGAEARLPPAFYVAALIVVLVSMWMMARAGWDV